MPFSEKKGKNLIVQDSYVCKVNFSYTYMQVFHAQLTLLNFSHFLT